MINILKFEENISNKILVDIKVTIGYIKLMQSEELCKWRQQLGLTQEELSRLLGVYRVTINRWERGARAIPAFLPLALEALEHRLRKEEKGDGMHQ